MAKLWKCEVCGYIHKGDEPPHECPICGVGREMFVAFTEASPAARSATPPRRWRCTVCDHVHEGDGPPDHCPLCSAGASLFEPAEDEGETQAVQVDVERVVIVGAGIAGVTAAEQARAAAPDVTLTLVSREPGLPYYRLNLTRYLAGEVDEPSLILTPPDWTEKQQVTLVHGEVVEIDRGGRAVVLRDGQRLAYDRLVITTGAHPFVPPILGATRAGVSTLRTLSDTRQLLERATPGAQAVCVGGGLLGLETAGALLRRGLKVTVVEGFNWLLPRQLAEPAGKLLATHLEGLGMTLRVGAKVEELVGDEAVRGVRLAGDEVLPADLVVLVAGVRPNSYLARRAGVKVKSGILVDDRLVSSDPAILAAGDVAEHRGVVYGLWPASYAEGAVAGTNAVGGKLEFRGLAPSNRLKVLDVDLVSVGLFQPPDGSYAVWEDEGEGRYLRLVTRDGTLVGANLYGDTSLAGPVKDAIDGAEPLVGVPDLLGRFPEGFQDQVRQADDAS